MLTKFIRSFIYAIRGLITTWVEEFNFRVEIIIGVVVIIIAVLANFSWIETMFCLIAIVIVLSAEIVNTAIEDLCDKVEPSHDRVIGKIKDTMAAFVLLSSIGALLIAVFVFYHHFLT